MRAPEDHGDFTILFNAIANEPVETELVFTGLLVPAHTPYGGRIHIAIPVVHGLPEHPDVAITRIDITLGPQHLTYYERIQGKIVPYIPRGILLPEHCPRHGFPFNATFTFLDGSHTHTHTAVPCPRQSGRART